MTASGGDAEGSSGRRIKVEGKISARRFQIRNCISDEKRECRGDNSNNLGAVKLRQITSRFWHQMESYGGWMWCEQRYDSVAMSHRKAVWMAGGIPSPLDQELSNGPTADLSADSMSEELR